MKFWKIFAGLGLILAAVLLVLDALGIITPIVSVVGEITLFEIVGGLIIIALIIERLIRGKIPSIFLLLAFLFMIFEENIAFVCGITNDNIINNWLVLLVALLLTVGFSILLPSRKRKKSRGSHGGNIEINGNSAESNLGSSTIYIDCESFTPSVIENSLGSCSVHFENAESYKGGETLRVENNLGSMVINVPENWIVKSSIENNLGGTHIANGEDKAGPILYIRGENNLGSLTVRYV